MFQVVCSQSIKKGSYLIDLPNSFFLDYLSTILPHGIQPDTLINEPKSFPIKFLINYSFHSGKYIYLGESCHNFHPVGGQGLNLCWRDVESLTYLISSPLLRKNKFLIPLFYSIIRFVDILSISLITDSLVRYSRSNINIFYIPRILIFILLKKLKIARKSILNIMTNGL